LPKYILPTVHHSTSGTNFFHSLFSKLPDAERPSFDRSP
jgi:hypothetical protein